MIKSIKEICKEIALENYIKKPDERLVSTGFAQLDSIIGINNLNGGYLMCIASMQGIGKSTFMLDLLLNSAITSEGEIFYFTNEFTSYRIVERLIQKLSSVNIEEVDEIYDSDMLNKVDAALSIISQLKITVIDYSETCENIKNILSFNRKPAMVLIDGFEAISHDFEKDFLIIRNLCKGLNIPIIISVWLERVQENRFRPTLNDVYPLVAKLADSVLILHRDSYFDVAEKQDDSIPDTELIICKNKNGELGTIRFKFDGETYSFIE
ncbi:MAG: hypothetical protein IJ470_03495 [Clostridia bacterium]|nr:hypothetical protein [Clostridia bacterium]